MPPRLRKASLVLHVVSSAGWIGAVVVFVALALAGVSSDEPATVAASYVAMDVAASRALVPLALASLATGLVQSVGTHWGLFRHHWVVIKLVVTVVAVVVLLLQLDSIRALGDAAAAGAPARDDLAGARSSLVVHAVGGLLVLLVPMVLSVYKPRGVTRFGERRMAAERAGRAAEAGAT